MKNLLTTAFYIFSKFVIRAAHTPHTPNFSPCTFPSPLYQPLQFRSYCNLMPHLPFICDLHQQLSDSGSTVILEAFEKFKSVLVRNDSSLALGILVVRQLAPPTSSSIVYSNKHEYGCLFDDEYIHMNAEKIQQFVISARTFIKIYASTLYKRWFLEDTIYNQPNILAIIILDGLVNDVRKLPYVKIYTGWPLHLVIADLIEQLGHSLREFCLLDGGFRSHIVPSWAIHIFIFCILLSFLAIFMEWISSMLGSESKSYPTKEAVARCIICPNVASFHLSLKLTE
ncbi:unnamed protein product [Onchocerca ochengi]|uniref:Cyclin N-terminal domain-containing protein n=1 Tax=Onchocerca ochengi TaxID=42157 RepID=A0A182EFR3_ONCOC|nr:unnamed protein product [Onchocerca ochengi]